MGRWNVFMLLLLGSSSLTSALITMSYQFLGATPDYWCRVDTLLEANWTQHQILSLAIPYMNETRRYSGCLMNDYNYTAVAQVGYDNALNDLQVSSKDPKLIACQAREFNLTQHRSSVVTEWDLVCERRALYSSTQAANQFGFLLGSFLNGYLLDAYGRRPVTLANIAAALLLGFLGTASPNAQVFIFLRFVLSMASMGVYFGSFVILIELCTSQSRAIFGALFVMPWALGYMIVPGIAYLVRDWRYLQTAIVLPYAGLLVFFWMLPESPRWLILHHRDDEALQVLDWAARVNKRTLPARQQLLAAVSRIRAQMLDCEKQADKSVFKNALAALNRSFSILKKKELRRKFLIMCVCWFIAALTYYGVSLGAHNINADPYLYIFLGGLLEVPSYLAVWGCMVYHSRRLSVTFFFILCGVSILANTVVMVSFLHVPVAAKVFLSLCGKLGIAAAFHLLYVYTVELFPTECRSLALGECSVMSRLGSVASPYVNDLLGESSSWAPSAVFAGTSLVAGALTLLLPETRNRVLLESQQLVKNTIPLETPSSRMTNTEDTKEMKL